MTTSVVITHKGPDHHDVMVEVIDHTSAGPTTSRSIRLKAGDTSEDIAIYDRRTIALHETPKEKAAELHSIKSGTATLGDKNAPAAPKALTGGGVT